MLTGRQLAALDRFRRLADLLDRAFRVPGTRWRFGWDALIGLVPGAGDIIGALFALYGLGVARSVGAPPIVQARMLVNIAIDLLAGAVPGIGDAFDFFYQAHARNRLLLDRWLERPQSVTRRSRALLIGLPLAAVGLVLVALTLAVWLAVLCARGVVGLFQ